MTDHRIEPTRVPGPHDNEPMKNAEFLALVATLSGWGGSITKAGK